MTAETKQSRPSWQTENVLNIPSLTTWQNSVSAVYLHDAWGLGAPSSKNSITHAATPGKVKISNLSQAGFLLNVSLL